MPGSGRGYLCRNAAFVSDTGGGLNPAEQGKRRPGRMTFAYRLRRPPQSCGGNVQVSAHPARRRSETEACACAASAANRARTLTSAAGIGNETG